MRVNGQTARCLCGRGISLLLVLAMTLPLAAPAHAAVAPDANGMIKGEFKFSPHIGTSDLPDHFIYTDEFFEKSALEYNPHLATMSMALTTTSISSLDVGIPDKSRNLKNLLTDIGFEDFETNQFYKEEPKTDTMGVAAAHKTIMSGGKEYTLLAVVPRSAGYAKEWAGNFKVGDGTGNGSGVHEGFADGRTIVLDFAKQYVTDHTIQGDVKLWTVGYSRGAGVANLVSAALIDDPDCLGFTLKPENLYCYTFGTPPTVPDEPKFSPKDKKYAGIFSVYADYDIVTIAPFEDWNFVRYGTTIPLPVYDAAAKSNMLGFLKNTSSAIYDLYTAPGSGADPDNFSPKKIVIDDSGFHLANDTAEETQVEKTQAAFLHGRTEFLSVTILPDRETYAATYQYAIETLAELYFGLSGENMGRFLGGMGAEPTAKLTAELLYGYYAAIRVVENAQFVKDMLAQVLELETQMIGNAKYEEMMNSGEYRAMKAALEATVAAGEGLKPEHVEALKGMTNEGLKVALAAGLTAISADEETKTKVTDDRVTVSLIDLLAYTLFGSTDETIDPLNIESDQLKMAATLLGNAGSYMRVHNNEILISWLRAQDSYYDEAPIDYPDDDEDMAPPAPLTQGVPTQGAVSVYATTDELGNAAVILNNETVAAALSKAKADAQKAGTGKNGVSLTLHVKGAGSTAGSLTVVLPKAVQKTILEAKPVSLVLMANGRSIRLDAAAITALCTQGQADVSIVSKRLDSSARSGDAKRFIGARPLFEFKITTGDQKTLQSFGGGKITISIPYALGETEKAGNVRAVYVDEAGNAQWLTSSVYDSAAGVLRVSTNSLSIYGVGYQESAALSDVSGHWAEQDILFAVNRGLLFGADGTFLPEGTVLPATLAAALTTLSGKDMTVAVGQNMLLQTDGLTREQIAVIFSKYAKTLGIATPTSFEPCVFADDAKIGADAKEAVKQMQRAGVLTGKSGNLVDPQGKVTRAQLSTMLRRLTEMSFSNAAAQGWVMNDSGELTYYDNGKPLHTFLDTLGHWAEADIAFAAKSGLMDGVSNTAFSPNAPATRGMIVTALYRQAGSPQGKVDGTQGYAAAQSWGVNVGVSDGTAMERAITRQELVTMLYRYAKQAGIDVSVGEDTNILSYNDAFEISPWAVPAFQWACGAGLIEGSGNMLMPQDSATRAQAAVVLQGLCDTMNEFMIAQSNFAK